MGPMWTGDLSGVDLRMDREALIEQLTAALEGEVDVAPFVTGLVARSPVAAVDLCLGPQVPPSSRLVDAMLPHLKALSAALPAGQLTSRLAELRDDRWAAVVSAALRVWGPVPWLIRLAGRRGREGACALLAGGEPRAVAAAAARAGWWTPSLVLLDRGDLEAVAWADADLGPESAVDLVVAWVVAGGDARAVAALAGLRGLGLERDALAKRLVNDQGALDRIWAP